MRLPSLFPALTLGATLSVTLFSGSMLKPASAANFLVTNLTDATDGACTADNCSLREALDSANVAPSADVISFEPSLFTSRQTLTVSQPYNVQDAGGLTINGPGAGLLTISGGNASRIFSVRLKATLALSGVTLTEGNGKGVPLYDVGGALYNEKGNLSLIDCVLTGNRAEYEGGVIYTDGGKVSLLRCSASSNRAHWGGVISSGLAPGDITLTDCNLSGNQVRAMAVSFLAASI